MHRSVSTWFRIRSGLFTRSVDSELNSCSACKLPSLLDCLNGVQAAMQSIDDFAVCTPCTNAKPQNSEFVATKLGQSDNCAWECDEGYTESDAGECLQQGTHNIALILSVVFGVLVILLLTAWCFKKKSNRITQNTTDIEQPAPCPPHTPSPLTGGALECWRLWHIRFKRWTNCIKDVLSSDATPTLLTIALLRKERSKGNWCVADSDGPYYVATKDPNGKVHKIRCSFVLEAGITFMTSYRWRDMHTIAENGGDIAVNFEHTTAGRGRCWVDVLNHLNDSELKLQVIEQMGQLYATKPTLAQYFQADPKTIADLFRMVTEATRGWMWQEIAVGPGVVEFGSSVAKLCFLLIQLGKEEFYQLGRSAAGRALQDLQNELSEEAFREVAQCWGPLVIPDDLRDDPTINAMIVVLEFCLGVGPRLQHLLEDPGRLEEMLTEHDNIIVDVTRLLEEGVPEVTLSMLQQCINHSTDQNRFLSNAAANLQNRNIGRSDTIMKDDVVDASLCAICTKLVPMWPECEGRDMSQREQYELVLSKMREKLIGKSCQKTDIFFPVPCHDRRVADVFGFNIVSARLEGVIKQGKLSNVADGGLGLVRLKVGEAFELGCHTLAFHPYQAPDVMPESPPVGKELEVASIRVCYWRDGGCGPTCIAVACGLVTSCGIQMDCDLEGGNVLLAKQFPVGDFGVFLEEE
mmetsp:Transcript_68561/g.142972  ORF Transcript_68561/g.142972 Transcript_68561/m.142972 type:complete len:691 (-) Transcript_68561:28-2100(-)